MAENRVRIDAPPESVFAVLADADAYAEWVVGAKEIRSSDPEWPNVGARFHHSIGAGDATIDDSSVVLACEPDRRLDLEVRFRPAGVAKVSLELDARGAGTLVTMREVATRGPARKAWGAALNAATHVRNAWALRRLRRLVERRAAAAA